MKPSSLYLQATVYSVVFWLTDSFVDYHLFSEHETLIEAIIAPDSMELWMRLLACTLILGIAGYAQKALNLSHQLHKEVENRSTMLEQLVAQKTEALSQELEHSKVLQKELEAIAVTDQLTNLFNRRYFYEALNRACKRQQRNNSGLFILLLDIDHFKSINDNLGHAAGDAALRELANLLIKTVRETDVVARWGGEEFIILVEDSTLDQAIVFAERVRAGIDSYPFTINHPVSVSIGIARYYPQLSECETTISRADLALYEAKRSGRNQVKVFDQSLSS